jgi:carbonic anhydrase
MDRLIEGHKHFHARVFPEKKTKFRLLSESQSPEFLFITCADSRIVPDLILGTGPGELFISRSIGNIIPSAAAPDADGTTATIEYAVEALKVRHVIVCGHSDCGALKAAVDRKAVQSLPRAQRWLRHVEPAFNHRQPVNPADGEGAELAALIRGNVVAQLESLKGQPAVVRAMQEGRLAVHGWYYDILTGRIERYDERERRFVPLLAEG